MKPESLTDSLADIYKTLEKTKVNLATSLHHLGLSANIATYLGLFFAALTGIFIFHTQFLLAFACLFISGAFDLLDGAIARQSKTETPFGGVLDSSLDRYGDGFVFGGIILLYASYDSHLYTGLAISALLGSFAVSYVRARTECIIERCKVGFWERGERMVYLLLGLLLNNLTLVILVLAIGTHLTSLTRLFYAKLQIKKSTSQLLRDPQVRDIILGEKGRRSPVYLVKIGLLILLVIFARFSIYSWS